jgi:hypothetical protein
MIKYAAQRILCPNAMSARFLPRLPTKLSYLLLKYVFFVFDAAHPASTNTAFKYLSP